MKDGFALGFGDSNPFADNLIQPVEAEIGLEQLKGLRIRLESDNA